MRAKARSKQVKLTLFEARVISRCCVCWGPGLVRTQASKGSDKSIALMVLSRRRGCPCELCMRRLKLVLARLVSCQQTSDAIRLCNYELNRSHVLRPERSVRARAHEPVHKSVRMLSRWLSNAFSSELLHAAFSFAAYGAAYAAIAATATRISAANVSATSAATVLLRTAFARAAKGLRVLDHLH